MHHNHDECIEKQEITIKFEKLEIDLNVNIKLIPPEPKVKGELTLGPVSNKRS